MVAALDPNLIMYVPIQDTCFICKDSVGQTVVYCTELDAITSQDGNMS